MLTCLKMYLVNGLVQCDYTNLEVRKYIKETSHEFYEWANNDTIKQNERLNKLTLFTVFLEEYPDWKTYKLTNKRFWQWMDKYCEFNNLNIEKGQDSMGARFVEISK